MGRFALSLPLSLLQVLLPLIARAQPAQPSFTAEPCTIPDVVLGQPAAPGQYPPNIDSVLGPTRTPETDSWLPFAVTVSNNATHSIVAYAARWTIVDKSGAETDKVTIRSLLEDPSLQISPGTTVVLLPFWLLAGHQRGVRASLTAADYQPDDLHEFQTARSIRVVLDGVVFSSGEFAGPNTTHAYEQLQAGVLWVTTWQPRSLPSVMQVNP